MSYGSRESKESVFLAPISGARSLLNDLAMLRIRPFILVRACIDILSCYAKNWDLEI